ncbi:hypothetical protein Agub_g1425, partial [Astrephomene gubernaculifera]
SGAGNVAFEDMVSAGMEGLMHALRKFRPEAGFRLSTYATWWIRQYIARFVKSQMAVFNLPVSVREAIERLNRIRAGLRARQGGVEPSPEQLAEAAGLSVGRVGELQAAERHCRGARSLEAPLDEEGGSRVDLLMQDAEEGGYLEGASQLLVDSEEHFALASDLAAAVEGVLGSLEPRDADILRERYGLKG